LPKTIAGGWRSYARCEHVAFWPTAAPPRRQELVNWFNAVDLTYRSDLHELNELHFA
jgi:hypothetical protein